jgi:UDP-3-O-[3-hydroxymyristoyl] glucosamine N-acyltransferase
LRPFETAGPGDLTLAAEKRYQERIRETGASAVIVSKAVPFRNRPLLRVDNPRLAFARLLQFIHKTPFVPTGVSPHATVGHGGSIPNRVSIYPHVHVGNGVTLGEEVTLHPGVHVGNGCTIGDGTILHPNVTVYDGIRIGARVILHSGAVIGADGFGYVFDGERQVKIPQRGTVVIEDDVEIGANSCVDRATFGQTTIGRGVKLDDHVQIGHNCTIGENTVMVGQVGVSGSVTVGRNCILAGQSGVVDHVRIGDGVKVLAKTAVTKDIPDGMTVSGQPAREHRTTVKIQALTRRLPQLMAEWRAWKKRQP